jgi:hypothetical protein
MACRGRDRTVVGFITTNPYIEEEQTQQLKEKVRKGQTAIYKAYT